VETLKTFWTFLQESWQEVRYKVTWPSQKEVQGTTWVVLVTTALFAIFLGIVDLGMLKVIQALFDLEIT
jgi:preprotein translocase subunit SecE